MEWITILSSLAALIILEIILGIDNLIFLSILTEKLPKERRKEARRWGLTLAWVTRLLLLVFAFTLVQLTTPLLTVGRFSLSMRDLFLLVGGLFLMTKATQEIHDQINRKELTALKEIRARVSFGGVIIQIALMDIIFSLDSVLTAIGLSSHLLIMATAITCAIIVMLYASEPVSHFIEKYPTLKILALSFLILIGVVLVAEGLAFHIPRGYLYFAMGFSLSVEALNLIIKSRY